MKVLALLIFVLHSLIATTQVKHYYTNMYSKGQYMGDPRARRQYMDCVAQTKIRHRKDLFDDDNYWKEVNQCKSAYNKTVKKNPPYI